MVTFATRLGVVERHQFFRSDVFSFLEDLVGFVAVGAGKPVARIAIQGDRLISEHCKCRVIGNGVQVSGRLFCCTHCASAAKSADVTDRAGSYPDLAPTEFCTSYSDAWAPGLLA
jgi:hypothetical protein